MQNSPTKIIIFLLTLLLLSTCSKDKTGLIDPTVDDPNTLRDIDGNIYQIVTIGTQVWMAENLKTTRFRNGEPIPLVTVDSIWAKSRSAAFCRYLNDSSYAAVYGNLYNWFAVNDERNIAPQGWHVPNDAEWQVLVDFLGGKETAGGKMKQTGAGLWIEPNAGATNECGFNALPGGFRSYFHGRSVYMGFYALFWSATEGTDWYAFYRELTHINSAVNRNYGDKPNGFSVRCIRD